MAARTRLDPWFVVKASTSCSGGQSRCREVSRPVGVVPHARDGGASGFHGGSENASPAMRWAHERFPAAGGMTTTRLAAPRVTAPLGRCRPLQIRPSRLCGPTGCHTPCAFLPAGRGNRNARSCASSVGETRGPGRAASGDECCGAAPSGGRGAGLRVDRQRRTACGRRRCSTLRTLASAVQPVVDSCAAGVAAASGRRVMPTPPGLHAAVAAGQHGYSGRGMLRAGLRWRERAGAMGTVNAPGTAASSAAMHFLVVTPCVRTGS